MSIIALKVPARNRAPRMNQLIFHSMWSPYGLCSIRSLSARIYIRVEKPDVPFRFSEQDNKCDPSWVRGCTGGHTNESLLDSELYSCASCTAQLPIPSSRQICTQHACAPGRRTLDFPSCPFGPQRKSYTAPAALMGELCLKALSQPFHFSVSGFGLINRFLKALMDLVTPHSRHFYRISFTLP